MSSREKLLWVTVLRVTLEVSQSCRHRDILRIRSDTEKKVSWQDKGFLCFRDQRELPGHERLSPLTSKDSKYTSYNMTTSLSSATPYESMRVIFFQTIRVAKTHMVFALCFFVFQVLLRTWITENINA